MVQVRSIVAVVALCAAGGCESPPPTANDADGHRISITGIVLASATDDVQVLSKTPENGIEPLAGVTVTLASADGSTSSVETGPDGRFSVGPVRVAGRPGDSLVVTKGKSYKGLELAELDVGETPPLREGINVLYVALPTPACAPQPR